MVVVMVVLVVVVRALALVLSGCCSCCCAGCVCSCRPRRSRRRRDGLRLAARGIGHVLTRAWQRARAVPWAGVERARWKTGETWPDESASKTSSNVLKPRASMVGTPAAAKASIDAASEYAPGTPW